MIIFQQHRHFSDFSNLLSLLKEFSNVVFLGLIDLIESLIVISFNLIFILQSLLNQHEKAVNSKQRHEHDDENKKLMVLIVYNKKTF